MRVWTRLRSSPKAELDYNFPYALALSTLYTAYTTSYLQHRSKPNDTVGLQLANLLESLVRNTAILGSSSRVCVEDPFVADLEVINEYDSECAAVPQC
jgi:hypothetical protein